MVCDMSREDEENPGGPKEGIIMPLGPEKKEKKKKKGAYWASLSLMSDWSS